MSSRVKEEKQRKRMINWDYMLSRMIVIVMQETVMINLILAVYTLCFVR